MGGESLQVTQLGIAHSEDTFGVTDKARQRTSPLGPIVCQTRRFKHRFGFLRFKGKEIWEMEMGAPTKEAKYEENEPIRAADGNLPGAPTQKKLHKNNSRMFANNAN